MSLTSDIEDPEAERLGRMAAAAAGCIVIGLLWLTVRDPGTPAEEVAYLTASQQARVDASLARLTAAEVLPPLPEVAGEVADLPSGALIRYLAPYSRSGTVPARRAALTLLRGIPTTASRDTLLDAALRTGCPDQHEVLRHAARLDRAGTVLRLVHYLGPEQPISRRVHAAMALGTLRGVEAFTTLVRLCQDVDEVPFLRKAAFSAVESMGTPGLEGVLLDLLEDPDENFSTLVAGSLAKRYAHVGKVEDALRRRRAELRNRDAVPTTITQLIRLYARRHDLDPFLVRAVIKVESDFERRALSSAGAQGLMQLMPATAAHLGVQDPFDVRQNISGGTLYLRKMLDRFGTIELALAAYNAGPTAVDRYKGVPPFPETRRYVKKVMSAYQAFLGG